MAVTPGMVLAALWGFAEATLFFVVPDAWLTLIAVRHGRGPALRACGYALAGALLGGLLMYRWGASDPATARAALDGVPAIGPAMIEAVGRSLADQGAIALFAGPITGVPYKIYAAEAAAAGVGVWTFLLVSVPARLLRFVALTLIASGVSGFLARYLQTRGRTALLLIVWTAFYAAYLLGFPG